MLRTLNSGHSTLNRTSPRRAVRSARHPVTVEIVGSNPIEDAYRQVDAVRNLAKRRSSNLRGLWVRLPPASLHWVVFPTAACKAVVRKQVGWRREVQFLHDPFNTARSSSGSGCWPLKPATRVQIPHRSLFNNKAKWCNW